MTLKRAGRGVAVALCVMAGVMAGGVPAAAQTPSAAENLVKEARQAYDNTEYERARELLDSVIAQLGTGVEQRALLVNAHELRARTRVNLDDEDGARTDFRTLLLLDPGYLLSAQVAPRVLALFEEVKKTTVGTIALEVTPADALVMLDDKRITTTTPTFDLVGGTHTITASRTGYAGATQTFTVVPGTDPQRIVLALNRTTSSLVLMTSPANVEIVIDGVSRGVTELDPDAKGEAGASVSKKFTIADLQNGRHRIQLRRECYVSAERELDVPKPGDYNLESTKLMPAVASVTITSNAPNATVFVDDTPKGPAPLVLDDVCEGQHDIEVRTAFGRHLRRFTLKPGQREAFQARVRPAFALISDSGAAGDVRGGPDLRMVAENAFQTSGVITLVAPQDKRAQALMAADQLPIDWLAFDILRQPIGKATTIGAPARAEIAGKMMRALSVQGLAAVARDPSGQPNDMLLILLAPGSSEPDVIKWRLEDPASIRDAVRQLDQTPTLYRSSIGVLPIDVHDVDGAVVIAVNPGSSSELAGLRPGDTIVNANGGAIRGVAELAIAVNARQAGDMMRLGVVDPAGAARNVDVAVHAVPNVVSLADRGLLTNKLAVEFTYRTAFIGNPLDEVAVRLNLATLALRLNNSPEATREIERVAGVLKDGKVPGALVESLRGTADFLQGHAAEASGDAAGAERAWRAAATSSGILLSEDGTEPVKDAVEQRLSQLTSTRPGR